MGFSGEMGAVRLSHILENWGKTKGSLDKGGKNPSGHCWSP